ncbi:unnamed protein product [Eruca vesicaria subsp. sativa]|uniref:Trans-cinnamate 4-monooxygenase n=1 Tax=Eruca vesicaria subsp. sativa TaxID=29727 RepID=A0ABC8JMJ2_ERUVS|nr:unnamed protein product [Eruca vesicaria subsp. sativa]
MGVSLLVPHMNLKEAKLAGYDIPAESKILVNAWWLTNNPSNWKKPEEFRPGRYLPFGVGRRSCPGIVLALPKLGITIGRLVQNFELLPPPGQSKEDERQVKTLRTRNVVYGSGTSHLEFLTFNIRTSNRCINVVFDYQLFVRTIAMGTKVELPYRFLHFAELDSPRDGLIFTLFVMLSRFVLLSSLAPGSSASIVNFNAH